MSEFVIGVCVADMSDIRINPRSQSSLGIPVSLQSLWTRFYRRNLKTAEIYLHH